MPVPSLGSREVKSCSKAKAHYYIVPIQHLRHIVYWLYGITLVRMYNALLYYYNRHRTRVCEQFALSCKFAIISQCVI